MPLKPSKAASMAMMKNMTAQPNIWFSPPVKQRTRFLVLIYENANNGLRVPFGRQKIRGKLDSQFDVLSYKS